MDLSSIALQGFAQANVQLEAAAARIARAGGAASAGANVDTVDLSTELVALMAVQALSAANAGTVKVADQVLQRLVDLTA